MIQQGKAVGKELLVNHLVLSSKSKQAVGHMSSVVCQACYNWRTCVPKLLFYFIQLSLGLIQVMFPCKSCFTDILFSPTDTCFKTTIYVQVWGNCCKKLLKSTHPCLNKQEKWQWVWPANSKTIGQIQYSEKKGIFNMQIAYSNIFTMNIREKRTKKDSMQ